MRAISRKVSVMGKSDENRAYKNYIFDFYGTLVDILTDEKDPVYGIN